MGQGRLASVTGPLANSQISFAYDELGRVTGRSINGGSNASSIVFDDLGRVSSFINPLTTGTYTYLGATALVTSGSYANGQRMNFGYYGAAGDERLQEIQNLDPSSNVISQFNYGYDSEGEITSWQQQASALTGTNSYGLAYDGASQLEAATLATVGGGGSLTSSTFGYWFDNAGNRTQEQIGSATTISAYNSLNQLTGQSPTGPTHFRGTMSKWGMVTVGGNPAVVSGTGPTYQFDGVANLVAGSNTVQIVATATSGVSGTSTYQVTVPNGIGRSFTYDADGEMTNNGAGQNYQWDAANRLAVIWSGTVGNSPSTTFTYNGLGQRVTAVQKDANNNLVMEQQFVWYPGDVQPSEERDASGNVTKRFFSQGEQISGTDYFYERDHLGSVRELADSSGAVKARYDYDLWGRRTKLSGTMDADFGYAGYYQHLPSGLSVTMFRAYDPNLGRWLSRDPIASVLRTSNPLYDAEMLQGPNLYEYVGNSPVEWTDPLGLWQFTITGGDVFAGSLTFGHNSGQWNIGAQVGLGGGLSLGLDLSDSGKHCKGYSGMATLEGTYGNGLFGASAGAWVNGGYGGMGASGRIGRLSGGGGFSGGYGNSGWSGNGGYSNYGASGFAGGGESYTW